MSNASDDREPLRRHRSSNISTGPEWYYDLLGEVIGPLTSAQLLAKVRSGEIAGNTPVRKDDSQWVNAEDVNGLFQAAHRDTVLYKCCYCGAKIDKPPTTCLNCDRDVTAAYRVREKPSSEPSATPPANGRSPQSEKQNGSRGFLSWFKSLLE